MSVTIGILALILAAMQFLGVFVNASNQIKVLNNPMLTALAGVKPGRVDKVIRGIIRSIIVGLVSVVVMTLAGLILIGVLS